MKIIYLKVKVVLKDDADVQDTISDVDYSFDHENILDTEIVDIEEET